MSEPTKLPEAQFLAVLPPGYQGIASAPIGLVITGVAKPPRVWNGTEWELVTSAQQSPRPAPGNTAH